MLLVVQAAEDGDFTKCPWVENKSKASVEKEAVVREYQFLFNNVNTVHRMAVALDSAFAADSGWCGDACGEVKAVLQTIAAAWKNRDSMRDNLAIAAFTNILCEKPRPVKTFLPALRRASRGRNKSGTRSVTSRSS